MYANQYARMHSCSKIVRLQKRTPPQKHSLSLAPDEERVARKARKKAKKENKSVDVDEKKKAKKDNTGIATMTDIDDLSKSFQSLGIPKTHATVGLTNLIASTKQYNSLFVHKRLPEYGWSDVQIQSLLFLFSTLDTNNKTLATCGNNEEDDTRWCGVGEREGRVFSSLVSQR
jgi:hypothetical protein